MSITLYDATDVIPSGFEGSAFEPVLKALADVCGAPFDTQTPNATVYRMAAIYALQHEMDELLIWDSDILNQLAAALRIPAWRQLARAETEDMRRLACRTLRVWLNYRGITGGAFGNSSVVFDDGASYTKPLPNSFIELMLSGGATAVSAIKYGGKDVFRVFADRPDDLLFFTTGYDPDTFDQNFTDYIESMYKSFVGILGKANIEISVGLTAESTELYSIGSHIQYDAIHDYMRNAYSIDGGISWMSPGELYDAGLMTTQPYFGPLHDENVDVGDPWAFSQGNVTYLRNSDDVYPFDAPYTRSELTEVITSGGTTMHGYDGTYTSVTATDYSSGLSQPEVTDDTGTLASFGSLSVVSMSAYFIPADLVDDEVYTNDYARTPTPAWSYTRGGRTWYFVRDRVGYDKKWDYGEAGLNAEGYTTSSVVPFPVPVTIGVTTEVPPGVTRITSGFWWMYHFNGGSSLINLWTPSYYATQTLLATSNQEQPGGAEYETVYFWNGSYMEDFGQLAITVRLQMYNSLPEFYTSSGETVTGTQCGIVIKPGYAPTWISGSEWDLPSDLYTISGTTLTWNTSHPLYNLLFNQPGSARND